MSNDWWTSGPNGSERPPWITPRNAGAVWGPMAGPEAVEYYVRVLRYTIYAALCVPFAIVLAVMNSKEGGGWSGGAMLSGAAAIAFWAIAMGCVTYRTICWFKFRRAARDYLHVTPEEWPGFAVRSPDALERWIREHRPSHR